MAGTAASLNRPPVISVWLAWVITGDNCQRIDRGLARAVRRLLAGSQTDLCPYERCPPPARTLRTRRFDGRSCTPRGHEAPGQVAAPYQPAKRVRVAVLGTITAFKGSVLLQTFANDAALNQRPLEFVVLGRTDRNAALARTGRVKVTGPYSEDEVFERLSMLNVISPSYPQSFQKHTCTHYQSLWRPGYSPSASTWERRPSEFVRGVMALSSLWMPALPRSTKRSSDSDFPSGAWVPPPPERPPASIDLLDFYYGFTDEERRRFGLPPGRTPSRRPRSPGPPHKNGGFS